MSSLATATPSSVVISNVIYLVGAVVLAVLVASILVLRHRKPKSVQSNMDTFHRGLAALAPDSGRSPRRRVGPAPVTANRHRHRVGAGEGTRDAGPTDADGQEPREPRTGAETG